MQTELFVPEKILQFADYLYKNKDFSAALNEYRRYEFLADSVSQDINEKIIDCLVNLKRYDEGIDEASKINNPAKKNYLLGWLYFLKGDYDSSRSYLAEIDVPYKRDARQLIGLGYAMEYKFLSAGRYLKLPDNFPEEKKVIIGVLLSLFPGGGHFYCGRIGDGIYSFLTVGLCTILSYYYYSHNEDMKFGIAAGAGILFYAGNIYGTINGVRNYNFCQKERYLQEILRLNR